ncbi:MAG: amino acid ABC transporter permease [Burkholderiales bacterium]|jgi:polar amino acid transport system permease protein|nr:amino acid ABC transporter permease [Burkholderiales bacterium]
MESFLNMLGQIGAGSLVTIKLFMVTLLFALPLGLAMAFCRVSSYRVVNGIANTYIWVLRGTPLMLQILFVYYGLPMIFPKLGEPGILPGFTAAALAFSLNYAAYFAEIFRGGIQSISKGQYEGAKVLGLTYPQTMRRIILPQVVKRVLPPLTNEVITLVKDTALVYVVAINDLLRVATNIVSRDFIIVPFLVAAVFYLVMTSVLTFLLQRLEKRYAVYDD